MRALTSNIRKKKTRKITRGGCLGGLEPVVPQSRGRRNLESKDNRGKHDGANVAAEERSHPGGHSYFKCVSGVSDDALA